MNTTITQLIIPLILYVLLFASGFIISISMEATRHNLRNDCPLFMNYTVKEKTFYVLPTNYKNCFFVVFSSIITCIFYGFCMILLYIYVLYRVLKGFEEDLDIIKKLPEMILNILLWIVMLVAAGVLTHGRSVSCQNFLKLPLYVTTCYDFEIMKNEGIKAKDAIHKVVLSEVTIWMCVIWFTALIVPTVVRLIRRKG